MGAGNVKAVYGGWSGRLRKHDRAFRLLVYMALTAKDEDDPPRYWGGREALAIALGRLHELEKGTKERAAAFEAVRAATEKLIEEGAIELVRRPFPGRNAEYILWAAPPLVQAEPAPNGTGSSSPSVQGEPAEWHRVSLRTEQGEPAPEDVEEDAGLNQGLIPQGSGPLTGGSSRRCRECDETESECRRKPYSGHHFTEAVAS